MNYLSQCDCWHAIERIVTKSNRGPNIENQIKNKNNELPHTKSEIVKYELQDRHLQYEPK